MAMQSLESMVQEAGSRAVSRELGLMVHETDGDPNEKEWEAGRFEKLSDSLALLGMYASKTGADSQAYKSAAAVFQWMAQLKEARAQIIQSAADGAKGAKRVAELQAESSPDEHAVREAEADVTKITEETAASRQRFEKTALQGAEDLAALAIVLSVNVDHLFATESEASSLSRIADSAVALDTSRRASSRAAEEHSAEALQAAATKLGAHGDKIYVSAPEYAAFGNSLAKNPTFQRRLEAAVLDQNATISQHMDGSRASFDEKQRSLQSRQVAIVGQARAAVPFGEVCVPVAEVQCATWDGAKVRQHPEVETRMMQQPESMFAARYVVGQGILKKDAMARLWRNNGSFPLSASEILPPSLMEVIKSSATVLRDLSDGDPTKELLASLRSLEGSEMMVMAARMVASSTAHIDNAMRILLHDIQINQLATEEVSFGSIEALWHESEIADRLLDLERLEAELLGLVWEQSQIARFPIAKALDKFVRAVGAPHLSPMASLDEKRTGDQRKVAGFSKDLMELVLEKCKEAKALAATKAAADKRQQAQQQQKQRGQKRGAQKGWQQSPQKQQYQQPPQQQQQQQPTPHTQHFSLQPADSSTTGKGKGAQLDGGRGKGRGRGKGKGGKGKGGRGRGH